MNASKTEFVKNWLVKANEDIAVVDELMRSDVSAFTSSICFHAQQAVEKFLKAFLAYKDVDFSKTHDVDYLLSLCINIENAGFSSIDLKSLAEFAVSVRYPDDFFVPAESEAKEYSDIAVEIKRLVESKIIL